MIRSRTAVRTRTGDTRHKIARTIRDEEYLPPKYEDEIRAAAARAMKCGARAPLAYQGIGMTSIVFCDSRGIGYKCCRDPETASNRATLEWEAEWLSVASTVPQIRDFVARFRAYYPKYAVIERECVQQQPGSRFGRADNRWERMNQIGAAMKPYGFGLPEFKEDSFVFARGRGWVLVDAGFAVKRGTRLVRQAVERIAGRRFDGVAERAEDIAFGLRMEAGNTIPASRANRLSARVLAAPPSTRRRG